jgi:hypothetical protein
VFRDLVIAALIIIVAVLLGALVKAVLFLVLIAAVIWLLSAARGVGAEPERPGLAGRRRQRPHCGGRAA